MSPRDFLEDGQMNESLPQVSTHSSSPRDFLEGNEDSNRKESFGTSEFLAGPRIAVDLAKGAYHALNSIPGYYRQSKESLPGAFNTIRQNPIHALGQGLAGLSEMGQNVFNAPHDLANYATNRLNLIPQNINQKIQMGRIPDSEQEINAQFGEPQNVGESLIRGTGRNLDLLLGARGAIKAAPHLTQRGASKALRKAQKLAKEREIGTLNVNPELIEDARQFLPNTLPHRNALNAAQTGDYNNLFKLQSDVGKNAGDYAKSRFSAAERSHGRAGLEARNRLLDAIHENLQVQGHHDISNLLRQGQSDYRRYLAFKPYGKILGLGAAAMLMPKNALTSLTSKILSI